MYVSGNNSPKIRKIYGKLFPDRYFILMLPMFVVPSFVSCSWVAGVINMSQVLFICVSPVYTLKHILHTKLTYTYMTAILKELPETIRVMQVISLAIYKQLPQFVAP